ncbi:MAG: hypothetical protein QXO40_04110 [Candidatus Aenigmatarchaeota archaeon]
MIKFLSRKFLSPFLFMVLSVLFKSFGFELSDKHLFIFGALVGWYIFMEGLRDIKGTTNKQ